MLSKTFKKGGYGYSDISEEGGQVDNRLKSSIPPASALHAVTVGYFEQKKLSLNASHFSSGVLPVGRLPAFGGDILKLAGSDTTVLNNATSHSGVSVKPQIDAKGRVLAGGSLQESDLPALSWSKIDPTTRPTTALGYGITDILKSTGGVMTGTLKVTGVPATNSIVDKATVDALAAAGGGGSSSGLTAGSVLYRTAAAASPGTSALDGSVLSKADHAALYAVIGDTYSVANNQALRVGAGRPWEQQYDLETSMAEPLTWEDTGLTLSTRRTLSAIIATKNKLYVIGGESGYIGNGNPSNAWTYFPINADGSLGAAVNGTMPFARSKFAGFVFNNYFYMIGGDDSSNGYGVNQIGKFPIDANGTIDFTSYTSVTIGETIKGATPLLTKDYLYLIGGTDLNTGGNSNYRNIYRASLAGNTVGALTYYGQLPVAKYLHALVVAKNRIHLLAGRNGAVNTNTILTATIDSAGEIGAWTTSPFDLQLNTRSMGVYCDRNAVYTFGNVANPGVEVYKLALDHNGDIVSRQQVSVLPKVTWQSGAVRVKDWLYVIGGDGTTQSILRAAFTGGANDYSDHYASTPVLPPVINFTDNFALPIKHTDARHLFAFITL